MEKITFSTVHRRTRLSYCMRHTEWPILLNQIFLPYQLFLKSFPKPFSFSSPALNATILSSSKTFPSVKSFILNEDLASQTEKSIAFGLKQNII